MKPRHFEDEYGKEWFLKFQSDQQMAINEICQRLGVVAFRPNYHGDAKDPNTVMIYFKDDDDYNREIDAKYDWLPNEDVYKKPFFVFENTDVNGRFSLKWANRGSIDLRTLNWREVLEGAISLAYYKKLQQRYTLFHGSLNNIMEADVTYNDLNREIIKAYKKLHGKAFFCDANYDTDVFKAIKAGERSVFTEYTGQKIYNFACMYLVPVEDEELRKLIMDWNSGAVAHTFDNADKIGERVRKIDGELFVWF